MIALRQLNYPPNNHAFGYKNEMPYKCFIRYYIYYFYIMNFCFHYMYIGIDKNNIRNLTAKIFIL